MSIDPGIKRLHIGLANTCNHRCTMCFIKDYSIVLQPIVWKERLTPLYRQLDEIMLAGGEPTFIDWTKEYVKYVLSINPKLKFSMFTNGHLFDDWWIQLFKERGTWVNFSLNAACKDTYLKVNKGGDWEAVIENIKKFRAALPEKTNMRINSSMVIAGDNFKEIAEFLQLSNDIGCNHASIFYDHNSKTIPDLDIEYTNKAIEVAKTLPNLAVWGLERFKQYIENSAKAVLPCGPINYNLYIDIYGDVRYCCLIVHPDGVIGNLYKNTLDEILNSEKAIKVKEMIKSGDLQYCSSYCSPLTKG